MTRKDLSRGSSREVYLDLLHTLEKVRGRLAVAVATETKATPVGRWRHYREMEDRLRRCVKELRSHGPAGLRGHLGWCEALEALKGIPCPSQDQLARKAEAMHLCQRIGDVLAPLERLANDGPRSKVQSPRSGISELREPDD